MTTDRRIVRAWADQALAADANFLVIGDDGEPFPVRVWATCADDVHQAINRTMVDGKVVEVYDLRANLSEQLGANRPWSVPRCSNPRENLPPPFVRQAPESVRTEEPEIQDEAVLDGVGPLAGQLRRAMEERG